MQVATQKKLINIFKTFIQKAIVPQLKKLEGTLLQWQKFSTLLLSDNLNYIDLQLFVDTMPVWGTNYNDKFTVFNKKNQADVVDTHGFKPSQSFGGQRNKNNMFNFGEDKADNLDAKRDTQREQSLKNRVSQNNINIWSNLEKLLKSLEENQNILDNIAKQNPSTTNRITRQLPIQPNSPIITSSPQVVNGYSHSYNYIPTSTNQTINTHQHQSHSQPHSHSQTYSQPYMGNNNYIKNYF